MRWLIAAWVSLMMLFARDGLAQNLIERPGQHPRYFLEVEPHVMVESRLWGSVGLGARVNFVVLHQGFIEQINNSIAVGVGLDVGYVDGCHYRPGICYRNGWDFVLPVNMQWNFWFTPAWSAFAEPGLAIGNGTYGRPVEPLLAVGGRYQLSSLLSLTLRVGYPVTSFGVSFFL
jgi:hypothetical protein